MRESSSNEVARSRMPHPAIYGSVTISGRMRPSRPISPGRSESAPPPTDISRGDVIKAAISPLRLCRFPENEAQYAARLFARRDHLAPGRPTEMLEVSCRAGVGREHFEDAAGRHRFQR